MTSDDCVNVFINETESNYIERLFYEYEAGKANIAFLMSQPLVKWDILQHYIDVVETRFVELEKAKKQMSENYLPEELKGKSYGYEFLFDENAIMYTTGDE